MVLRGYFFSSAVKNHFWWVHGTIQDTGNQIRVSCTQGKCPPNWTIALLLQIQVLEVITEAVHRFCVPFIKW